MVAFKWATAVQNVKTQIYISLSKDPFFNLSFEHYLLQKAPPNSNVLLFYINRPCIVIGRNQNPWLEANLPALKSKNGFPSASIDDVELVRRRSGGGAVFHDEGNVNYSVTCPSSHFTRNKHVVMVTEALREFTDRARVNERHDIVLDQGAPHSESEGDSNRQFDMFSTPFMTDDRQKPPLKVSGSAYKITRGRSLHHGTCLLASERIGSISSYLRSPARPFLKAYGSESVRSPVTNVLDAGHSDHIAQNVHKFMIGVIDKFVELYDIDPLVKKTFSESRPDGQREGSNPLLTGDDWIAGFVGQDMIAPSIEEGMAELQSNKWKFAQTPQFTLSSHPDVEEGQKPPPLPPWFPLTAKVQLGVKHGSIVETDINVSSDEEQAASQHSNISNSLKGRAIHEIDNFEHLLHGISETGEQHDLDSVARWLNEMFGKADRHSASDIRT